MDPHEMVAALEDVAESALTPWEQSFLSEVSDRLFHGRGITESQLDTLENLYATRVG
jgi:hypothetical protein